MLTRDSCLTGILSENTVQHTALTRMPMVTPSRLPELCAVSGRAGDVSPRHDTAPVLMKSQQLSREWEEIQAANGCWRRKISFYLRGVANAKLLMLQ